MVATLLFKNDITGSELVSFFAGILLLTDVGVSVSSGFTTTHQSMASVERLFSLLDYDEPIKNPDNPVEATKVKGKIDFKSIHFALL